MIRIFTVVTLLVCAQASPVEVQAKDGFKRYDIEERIAEDGFFAESHSVTTSDGYILEVNRIPFGRNENREAGKVSKPVIFLMHGLQGSSYNYFTSGAELSIAYNLADNGYDVWMGNARGVFNSRRHVTLDANEDTEQFFDYTFEDIGMKDLPAMIDFALAYTGQSQLYYIGHSQGGTAFLVLTSMLPEYNDKIISAHLLAGVGYQRHFPNDLLRLAAVGVNVIYSFAVRIGLIEIFGPKWNAEVDAEACQAGSTNEACDLLAIKNIMGDLLEDYEGIAGASIKQYAHYGQNIQSRSFRRWYYSPLTNLRVYGSVTPPEYDIKKITTDVTMHYTVSDGLLDERDVLDMVADMPNCRARKVARDSFSHTDFVIATDAKELVTDYIIEDLNTKTLLSGKMKVV